MVPVSGQQRETSLVLHSLGERENFLAAWGRLHRRSPVSNFFISAEWCAAWLDTFGPQLQPEMYSLRSGAEERACWMLVRRTAGWHGIPFRRVYVNTAGEDEADSPCVEYSSIVCDPEFQEEAMRAVWETIRKKACDEVVFPAAVPEAARQFVLAAGEPWPPEAGLTAAPAWYVDLEALRSSGKTYLEAISQKARYQVRQSMKTCASFGELRLTEARTREEAGAILEELADLHGKAWRAKDRQGAFASVRFRQFHQTLIERTFAAGTIQLIRVAAGEVTIGCLYNFVHQGVVHFYQSGLRYDPSAKNFRPGFVTLALAVQHCADRGLREFDMMAGDYEYKRSLSTAQREIMTVSLREANWKNRLIDLVRSTGSRISAGKS
jgi:CelD/BcsL family acetyltransferase involved in cellulose biosynthesis